jgi:hypothetical protein
LIGSFADVLALAYHEARNVRHLIRAGAIGRDRYKTLLDSLPTNRDAAWQTIQSTRDKARRSSTAAAALSAFSGRFRLTLADLDDLFSNPAWRDFAPAYGGNAWRAIVGDLQHVAETIDRGRIDDVTELLDRLYQRGHNTEPKAGVMKKLKRLDALLAADADAL